MRENSRAATSPIGKQTLLLLQALTTIVFTAASVYVALYLCPYEVRGILNEAVELYFVAVIANLVFFHTFDIHSRDKRPLRLLAVTALGSIGLSVIICGVYFLVTNLR